MKQFLAMTLLSIFSCAQANASSLDALAFMKGCWSSPDGENGQDTRIESWTEEKDGALHGSVQTLVLPGEEAGDQFSEQIQADETKGAIIYTVTIPEPGNPQNVFALTATSSDSDPKAVFTMTSSYSNKIKALVVTYSAHSPDVLNVIFEVTLADGSVIPAYGYTYQRTTCTAP